MKILQSIALVAVILTCGFVVWNQIKTRQSPAPPTAAAPATPIPVIQAPKPAAAVLTKAKAVSKPDPEDEGAVGPPTPCSPRADSIGIPCDHPIAEPPEPRVAKTHTTTVSVMPSQAFNIHNGTFRKVLIRSDYPLRVLTGSCHSDYTVQFFCEGDPADIFITDVRRMPVLLTPRANSVTITVTEF
jgi:hypothetical protein